MKRRSVLLVGGLLAVLVLLVLAEPDRYLNLAYLKAQQHSLQAYVEAEPLRAGVLTFAVYTAATALSIPGAIIMTLAAGAIFGLFWGTLIVSFASTLGATLAFLMSRYLFRGLVQARFGHRLEAINRGMRSDGPTYLLSLRLLPIVPYVAVNLLLALTPIGVRQFYLFSQIGMLPATLIYVNAGTQLAGLEQLSDIASAGVLGSLALLAAFPFLARGVASILRRRRLHLDFPPPAAVDRNVIVIGAGSAGLVASLLATSLKARVTLIESARMGGDCLNTGCVPSKALLAAARQVHEARAAPRLGLPATEIPVDFGSLMVRVRSVIKTIEPKDSIARYQALGVECITGHARLVSPYEVEVNGRRLSSRAIVLATGAAPFVPELPGLEDVPYLTSDTIWDLQRLPSRLLVLGGGPIGCELAQAFSRLGSVVTLVEMAPRLLPREDEAVSELLESVFLEQGMDLRLGSRAMAFTGPQGDAPASLEIITESSGVTDLIEFDEVLVALGRRPSTAGLGLEALGIGLDSNGAIEVNARLQTRLPSVYACGDVAGPYQFTHAASYQATVAILNALFGSPLKRFAADYRALPWCTFTDPQVARAGLNESEARRQGIAFEVTSFELSDLDRAIAEGETRGFIRVLTPPRSDRILGVTVVAAHAGDTIAEFVLAMKHGLGLKHVLDTVHIYPTFAEANKFAAGQWRKRHASPLALRWLERLHSWRRERRRDSVGTSPRTP